MRQDSLHPAGLAVAPVREEEVGTAGGAEVQALDVGDSRQLQRLVGRAPEIEAPVLDDRLAEARAERPGDVLADLVAARTDRRADRRGEPAFAERLHRRLDDPCE